MKRKVILVLVILALAVLVCVSLVWAQENENSNKPLFSFSAYGGMMRGEFALNSEFLYNQKWDKWGIQTSAMANVNKSIHEYGFSAGGWRQFGIMEFGLFFDTLYLEKIPECGYGGFHGQIRPEFRMVERDLIIGFFYGHPISKKYLPRHTISAPYFWQDARAHYFDIVDSRTYAVSMRYFGTEAELILNSFLKVRAEGIYAPFEKFEKDVFYRLRIGAEIRTLKWLAVSIDWTKMKAVQALGLNMGGDYQAVRIGATIFLGRNQEYESLDLINYGVITPHYPAVRVKTEYSLTTTKIADLPRQITVVY